MRTTSEPHPAPGSHYRPGQAGHAFKPETVPIAGEQVIARHRNSAFIGTELVADGCFAFSGADWNGTVRSAEEVHAMSLANLDGEYCTVVTSDALLGL